MSRLVYLDPGHGGRDAGAVNGDRFEKNDALRMAQAVEKLLTAQGVEARLTRAEDAWVSLVQRTDMANKARADLFVSLHRNSFSAPSANGAEVWVHTNPGAGAVGAAAEVLEELVKAGVQSNRGVKKGNYHVCRETKMPAMLVELGFISNPKDNELFDQKFSAYAEGIAKGICKALGVPWNRERPKQYARIQTGAYTYPENEKGARDTLEKLRKLGREQNIPELAMAFLVIPSGEQVEPE